MGASSKFSIVRQHVHPVRELMHLGVIHGGDARARLVRCNAMLLEPPRLGTSRPRSSLAGIVTQLDCPVPLSAL